MGGCCLPLCSPKPITSNDSKHTHRKINSQTFIIIGRISLSSCSSHFLFSLCHDKGIMGIYLICYSVQISQRHIDRLRKYFNNCIVQTAKQDKMLEVKAGKAFYIKAQTDTTMTKLLYSTC